MLLSVSVDQYNLKVRLIKHSPYSTCLSLQNIFYDIMNSEDGTSLADTSPVPGICLSIHPHKLRNCTHFHRVCKHVYTPRYFYLED